METVNQVTRHHRGRLDGRKSRLVETDGLLRYVTRTADYRPIWIPQGSQLAENLLKDAHRKLLHRGVQMSMAMMGD